MKKLSKETIVFEWTWQDVKEIDETLTKKQCCEVLYIVERKHDANIGMNWDFISNIIDIYKAQGALPWN